MSTPRISFVTSAPVEPAIVNVLRDNGFDVSIESAPVALEKLLMSPPDLLILDIPEPTVASELLKQVRSEQELKRTLVLVIAEWGSGLLLLALCNGADACEPKPVDSSRILEAVERLLKPNGAMTANASGPFSQEA